MHQTQHWHCVEEGEKSSLTVFESDCRNSVVASSLDMRVECTIVLLLLEELSGIMESKNPHTRVAILT